MKNIRIIFNRLWEIRLLWMLVLFFVICVIAFESHMPYVTYVYNGKASTQSQSIAQSKDLASKDLASKAITSKATTSESYEKASTSSSESSHVAPLITETLSAKLCGGRLEIYDGYGELFDSIEIDLTMLPPHDRQLLCEGIIFDNASSLDEFVESLDS